jgi:cytochrome c553
MDPILNLLADRKADVRTCRQAARLAAAAIAIALALCGCSAGGQTGGQSGQDMQTDMAAKVHNCAACHGADGVSTSELFPNLAGQQKAYIVGQVAAFRTHTRQDRDAKAYMWGIAEGLDDATIAGLAEYFSAQSPAPAPNDVKLDDVKPDIATGEAIYRHGALDRGVPPCASCHGDKAEGKASIPALAGQHRDYLFVQLHAFSSGSRDNAVMHLIAKKLTGDEKKALAAYLASL